VFITELKNGLLSADWWVAIFTKLLVSVTAFLAVFTYNLWRETKQAVLDTAESRRPWLHFKIKPISGIYSQSNTNFVNFKLLITNFGLSPAVNIEVKSILASVTDFSSNGGRPFYVDDKRFASVEVMVRDKESSDFSLFSFPSQKMREVLCVESAKDSFDPDFRTGIAFVFIYYQTPGSSKRHCTKRVYMILPPEKPSTTDQPNPARCVRCGENAE